MSRPGGATLRVVRSGRGDPAYNLALDAALLESAGPDTLRLYGWSPHGLSLGRFQDASAFAHVPGPRQMVRRQTGGGAIYHGDELTFSLAMDGSSYWPTEAAYVRVHDAVVCALMAVGVRARRLLTGAPSLDPRALRKAWCFATPRPPDVVGPDDRKLCGSAQRRIARPHPRVLHHGSIVLRRPAATPFCAAVEDQVDVERVREDLSAALVDALAAALGRRAEPGPLDGSEGRRARILAAGFAVVPETIAQPG